jgi:Thymidylate synthase complementing protein
MIESQILAHSRHPDGGELLTFLLTYPRFIHAETLVHRTFSRNASSSRAIPVGKMLRAIISEPAAPVHWGANMKGMQAAEELKGWRRKAAQHIWHGTRYPVMAMVWLLTKLGLHKQVANRLLEPWAHITVIASVTDHWFWHFAKLRHHKDAQPEFQALAALMVQQVQASKPQQLDIGDWHMPMKPYPLDDEGHALPSEMVRMVCVGRIARTSYLTHDGRRDIEEDIALAERLCRTAQTDDPGHWSPFEHVAQAVKVSPVPSNFGPSWLQMRHTFPRGAYDPLAPEKRK